MSSQQLFPGVALITGAGSGIGRGIACAFAREGCRRIVLADLAQGPLQETKDQILDLAPEAEALLCNINVALPEDVQQMLDATIEKFGRVDYAVNAAGILGATMMGARATGGECWAIVNIASQLGIVARPTAPAYCSSKAAVISMTKSDAIDYAKDNIRINCVCPGLVGTAMVTENIEYFRSAISISPMNRYGTVDEVADCVLFLCSSKATFVQGAAMVVDGGYTIN